MGSVRTTFLRLLLITAAALIMPAYFAVWKFLMVDSIPHNRLTSKGSHSTHNNAGAQFADLRRPVAKQSESSNKSSGFSPGVKLATETHQQRKRAAAKDPGSKTLQTHITIENTPSRSHIKSTENVLKGKYKNVNYWQSCKFLKTSKGLHRVCIDRYTNGSRGRLTAKAVMAQKQYFTEKPVLASGDSLNRQLISKVNSDDGKVTEHPKKRQGVKKPRGHRVPPSPSPKSPRRGILDYALWLSYIDPHDYRYLINPSSTTCQTSNRVDLLVLVTSHPENSERRKVIRETWGAPRGSTAVSAVVKVRFLLGVTALTGGQSVGVPSDLLREADKHDDLIMEEFLDSYLNLTIKTVMGLKWASRFCPDAHYVMKTDDDIIVNVPKILAFLHAAPRRALITGRLAKSYPVIRDKWEKFYMPKHIYSKSTYPDYCVGLGYIMSIDMVHKLYLQSLLTPVFPWEDVYVGIMLKDIGIIPKDIKNFYYFNGGSLFEGATILVAPKKTLYRLRSYYVFDGLTPEQTRILWKKWQGYQSI
ncbi:UDP-GlcNAc:betaGal beta-1,3-N-acetylglucosaminyltransferase 7-like [Acanthaster planci]|uniref:UDP-GlcNAc:betaGal beta-1,3-N-acetylglucosaminyltransferase 7-like n=1 Tax=Acanthaster planci TaxID=133434 RepID=A0A8B7Z5M8_ACAPL|nr:UDP-GlcNAc:betaGal beta-1,3-N-acetylglucosaminyltransferase 7-like [Acanthaster planci]XP_022100938.1 UDP-GlcNAc:betaGal beta-1,3-N-acetylglucosaminyltransferase 7-like [Acanthaster planci]